MAIDFEWDRSKAQANEVKHRVRFTDAIEALSRAEVWVVREDDRRDYGERRIQCLVADPDVADLVYLVVFTPRGRSLRLISARPAHRKERDRHARATA